MLRKTRKWLLRIPCQKLCREEPRTVSSCSLPRRYFSCSAAGCERPVLTCPCCQPVRSPAGSVWPDLLPHREERPCSPLTRRLCVSPLVLQAASVLRARGTLRSSPCASRVCGCEGLADHEVTAQGDSLTLLSQGHSPADEEAVGRVAGAGGCPSIWDVALTLCTEQSCCTERCPKKDPHKPQLLPREPENNRNEHPWYCSNGLRIQREAGAAGKGDHWHIWNKRLCPHHWPDPGPLLGKCFRPLHP